TRPRARVYLIRPWRAQITAPRAGTFLWRRAISRSPQIRSWVLLHTMALPLPVFRLGLTKAVSARSALARTGLFARTPTLAELLVRVLASAMIRGRITAPLLLGLCCKN